MTDHQGDLDPRRRKIRFRAWHRGMRETDLILGGFAEREIARLDEGELVAFEALLEENDADILKWVTGETRVPEAHDTAIFARIVAGSTRATSI